ncbi:uncharacterized protein I303_101623 [Kwoniella dejecticola CBS 10117]|uniref:Protein CPL1-like domain-containing protein n=1 Tax=Kwoniella dejecticola CBS 10117 TaxID=1296121 RepID=A0A1A6AD97_9TREE|nr:uncharacterized protein I303_02242 [Kwoniella dejecticola CBS 10117]OBR88024.1 hypothetical protein I303_02242 [Kwoniella dejecticola CBS 10117]
MLPRILLLLFPLLLASVAQAATFVGCVLAAEVALTGTNGGRANNQAACDTRCSTAGYQYSYFISLALVTSNNCYCDSLGSYVGASSYVVGSSASACVGITGALQASANDLSTTFNFNGCTGTLTGVVVNLVQGTILGGSIVNGPQECFNQCRGNLNAYVIPLVPGATSLLPTYGCVCDPSGPVTTGVCGYGQFYGFSHSASASQNAQSRKRQQLLLKAQDRKGRTYCPNKMKACVIPGSDASWECIDPQTELESCGGCAYGEYTSSGAVNATTTGVDCTRAPGVLLGGSTCTSGRCEIFGCKRQWKLVDGACVKRKTARRAIDISL